jgi:hypothetical protein
MKRILYALLCAQCLSPSYAVAAPEPQAGTEPAAESAGEGKREWGKETEGQAISIMTKKATFASGELVVLTISLRNVGSQDTKIITQAPLGSYDIEVLGRNGEKVPLTLRGKVESETVGYGSSSVTLLKKGQECTVEVPLNRLFDMSLPGKYTVSVTREVWKPGVKAPAPKAISNKIQLTMTLDDELTVKP